MSSTSCCFTNRMLLSMQKRWDHLTEVYVIFDQPAGSLAKSDGPWPIHWWVSAEGEERHCWGTRDHHLSTQALTICTRIRIRSCEYSTCRPKDFAWLLSPSVNRRPDVIICSIAFLKQSTIGHYFLACQDFSFIFLKPFFKLINGCEGGGLSSWGKPKAAGGKNFLRSTFLKTTFQLLTFC